MLVVGLRRMNDREHWECASKGRWGTLVIDGDPEWFH